MICKQCGSQINDGAAFCVNCGAKQAPAQPQVEKTIGVFGEDAYIPQQPAQPEQPVQTQQPAQPQTPPQPQGEKTVGIFGEDAYVPQPPVHTQQPPVQPQTPPQPVYTPPQTPPQPTYTAPAANPTGSNGSVSFGEAIKLYFVNYVNFTGRASRSEFWWAYLFTFLLAMLGAVPVVGQIIALGTLIPSLSIAIRRLHDIGKPWPYYLMCLIPLAGAIILIYFWCQPSDGDNQWGPGPQGAAPVMGFNGAPAGNPAGANGRPMSDNDIYALAQSRPPYDLASPEGKRMADVALAKIVPTYTGAEDLASAMMMCDPQTIRNNIHATDTDSLIVILKALGYYIGMGGNRNVLSTVQQSVLAVLKSRL